MVINHVRSQGYTLQGPVRISFRRDGDRRAGDFEIKSRTEKTASPSAPAHPAASSAPFRPPASCSIAT